MSTSRVLEYVRVTGLTNDELHDELAGILSEQLFYEIGLRLGVDGVNGVRATAEPHSRTGPEAERLRRYQQLWQGQPERA